MIIKSNPGHVDTERIVLFPFDDHGLPFRQGVRLHLVGFKTPVDRTRIVVPLGPPGAPDSKRVIYYGTVLRVGGELWMWYLGQGDDDHWHQRVCLATSRDGYHLGETGPGAGRVPAAPGTTTWWTCSAASTRSWPAWCTTMPDETDRGRRFKAVIETKDRPRLFGVLFSADGLRWREFDIGPAGAAVRALRRDRRFNGCYYAERARRQPLRGAAPVGDLPLVRLRALDRGVVPGAAARRHSAAALPGVVRRWRAGAPGRGAVEPRQRDRRPVRPVARPRQQRPPPRGDGPWLGGEQRRPALQRADPGLPDGGRRGGRHEPPAAARGTSSTPPWPRGRGSRTSATRPCSGTRRGRSS